MYILHTYVHIYQIYMTGLSSSENVLNVFKFAQKYCNFVTFVTCNYFKLIQQPVQTVANVN